MSRRLVDAYLARLGVTRRTPSAPALIELHAAHVSRVPYETTWIAMGEPWGVDPLESATRIAEQGRGGYCYHLNGAFSWLLGELGYHVTRLIGGVHDDDPNEEAMLNHLVLTVEDLPSAEHPNDRWYVDVGLGEGLYTPLPLEPGEAVHPPFTLRLQHGDSPIADWRLIHDRRGSFDGMAFREGEAAIEQFAERNVQLSTSPDSYFVRTTTAQIRSADSFTAMRALTLSRVDDHGTTKRVITDRDEWFATLTNTLHLDLRTATSRQRDRLWDTATAQHRQHLDGRG